MSQGKLLDTRHKKDGVVCAGGLLMIRQLRQPVVVARQQPVDTSVQRRQQEKEQSRQGNITDITPEARIAEQ